MKKFIKTIFSFSLFFSACMAEEYVTCHLQGQLGNQLFLVATTLAVAWDNNAIPVFPALNTETMWNVPYNKDNFFFRLNPENPKNIQFEKHNLSFDYKPIPYKPNMMLTNFTIARQHFEKYTERLQELFAPSDVQKSLLCSKYSEIIDHSNSVGVHIRVCGCNVYPFCGWNYFENAMNLFPDDALFVVCSDRIDWVKKHFPKNKNRSICFIEGNDHVIDFHLLSLCKNNIISPSTFGYWAAFLNRNNRKKVIAPSKWFSHVDKRTKEGFPQSYHFYPHDWIVLPVPLERKIPKDIQNFKSTSVDW